MGGNVETSSRVADVVLGAFGRALGQGTMNNVTLGDDQVTYYETIGGGQGACPDADGPSGVHVAMSNTLNTPIEALELEFPMRMVEYSLRRGSGGAGRFHGGDGVVRELEALAPLHYSLITERRRHAPARRGRRRPGRAGAQPARRRGAAAQVDRGAGRGPAAADRDPRGRGIRASGVMGAPRRPAGAYHFCSSSCSHAAGGQGERPEENYIGVGSAQRVGGRNVGFCSEVLRFRLSRLQSPTS